MLTLEVVPKVVVDTSTNAAFRVAVVAYEPAPVIPVPEGRVPENTLTRPGQYVAVELQAVTRALSAIAAAALNVVPAAS